MKAVFLIVHNARCQGLATMTQLLQNAKYSTSDNLALKENIEISRPHESTMTVERFLTKIRVKIRIIFNYIVCSFLNI